jgi:hypothetical protein
MRKFVVFATVLVLTIVALRRFGPTLGKRAMTKCQQMMAKYQGWPEERPWEKFDEEPTDPASIQA